jgi:hypothetical protein
MLRLSLLLILALLAISCGAPAPKTNQSQSARANEAPKQTPAPEEATVSATELLKVYGENEPRGDALYKGKMLTVTGKVNRVGAYFEHPLTVQVEGEGVMSLEDVICVANEGQRETLAALDKGQKVTVRGVAQGKSAGIILKDCTVINNK